MTKSPLDLLIVLCTFFIVMITVVIICYSRQSGNTGLDMAKIYKIRNLPQHSPTTLTEK